MSAKALKDYLPDNATMGMVVYLGEDNLTACKWFGISAEQAAMVLYQLADAIVVRLPPKMSSRGKPLK